MPALYDIDARGKLRMHMHPGQLRAWDSKARFTFVLAGTQSGKTSWGPWWLWREIANTADPAGNGNDYIAATASYDLFKLKMLPELRTVFEHTLKWARFWSSDRVLELSDPATGKFWAKGADDRMWGRIMLRSAASGGGLEALTGRAAWLDECGQDEFTVEIWEAVLRRLSLSRGRVLGTTTPYNLGWLLSEVYKPWRAGSADFNVIQFPSFINPQFSREEYERAKASMPAHRFDMFYRGLLTKPAGLIYNCWDDDIHLVKPFDIPPQWPRYVGIDFGAVNTALVWVAEDPNKRIFYAYRESLEGEASTAEHCRRAHRHAGLENVVLWLGGSPSEEQQRMDWNAEHIPVIQPYISDVEGGIARVYGLFKTKRLRVFDTCRGLLDEIGSYKRKMDDKGEPTEEIENKRTFHRLDALRYVGSALGGASVETGVNPWG